jgi:DegV family protein with EDD domain
MEEKKRKLYKIGHVISLLGITPRTLRYYEQFGLLPQVKRTKGNVRLFDDEDIELIRKIRKMQKQQAMPLQAIREALFQRDDQDDLKVAILTDSMVTIPEDLKNQIDLYVIPMRIRIGEEEYSDLVNVAPSTILEKSKGQVFKPVMTAPSEEDFSNIYLDLYSQGYKKIYSVHSSSKLFKTYENAVKAAEKIRERVAVIPIDSSSVGPGLGILVYQIGKTIKANGSVDEIDLAVAKQKPLVDMFFMADSLNHIVTGGFIKKEEDKSQIKMALELINFKPVISLKNEAGKTEIVQLSKHKNDAFEQLMALLDEEIQSRGCHNGFVQQIGIYYNSMYNDAMDFLNLVKEKYPYAEPFLCEGSAAMSLFFGPYVVGVALI